MYISENTNDTIDTVNLVINNKFILDLESLIQMSLKELGNMELMKKY